MASTERAPRRPHHPAARAAALVALGALVLAGCSSSGSGSGGDGGSASGGGAGTTAPASPYPKDDELRLNQIQVIGSHNSYHQRMPEAATKLLRTFIGDAADALDYQHLPLPQQFAEQGVRQIELDVFADPEGGLYATRHAAALIDEPAESPDPAMREPGFKVFHIQEIDFATSCSTFTACLGQVKGWSDANPEHVPLMILVEAKDTPIPDPINAGFVTPLPIDAAQLDAIDAEIRSVFGEDDLITPDDVRGSAATLEAAVLDGGWPTLADSRGKVMFALDNEGLRQTYATGHASLAGRVMFTGAQPGEPEAAFVKLNDPLEDGARITELVRKGYVVRTRADGDTEQARTGDTTMRDAALASGAQWVSTDYPDPDPTFGTDYSARFPDGDTIRCNPVSAPPGCTRADLERGSAPRNPGTTRP